MALQTLNEDEMSKYWSGIDDFWSIYALIRRLLGTMLMSE